MSKSRHSKRLRGALELHAKYVSGIKQSISEVLKKESLPTSRAHLALGLKPLGIEAPPMFESGFGYQGLLRFVAFQHSPATAKPVHSDGGDELPIPNADDWISFVSHPAVCRDLEQYSTLRGQISGRKLLTRQQFQELEHPERLGYCGRFHALVLDREERQLYIANWQSLKMFQPYSELSMSISSADLASPFL